MRRSWTAACLAVAAGAGLLCAGALAQPARPPAFSGPPPAWAFLLGPVSAPIPPPGPHDGDLKRVPGSAVVLTQARVTDRYNPPDWRPGEHPAMPAVVAFGRKPELFACGFCHLPNGQGRPENAPVASLPVNYLIRQMAGFKHAARPGLRMAAISQLTTDEEVRAAAVYFNSIRYRPWIEVIETREVPLTKPVAGMYVPQEGPQREPIGERIVEVPRNLEQTELRDAGSGFIAYVPVGAVEKGRALVAAGGGVTLPCAACHGEGLRGAGDVPAIAGRSPSYLARQMYDFQSGARSGPDAAPMAGVVAKLTAADMLAIAAYTASLKP